MKVQKLDAQQAKLLRGKRFVIAEDDETATISGEMTVSIIRPAGSDEMWLTITLPDYSSVDGKLTPLQNDDDETADEAA